MADPERKPEDYGENRVTTALITGITGQDGAYLSQLLLGKGYRVIGTHRRASELNLWRLKRLGIEKDVRLVPMELLEYENIRSVIEKTEPDEIYNLAAQSFVGASFDQPLYTAEVNGLGPVRILEAIRAINPEIKFYQASTSEMFGNALAPQDENTPFHPRSPYATAKVYAHNMTVHYREAYGIFACCGILFNHESPLRGMEFVTRKITYAAAKGATVRLGNTGTVRDWGFAGDYVEGMWMMMKHSKPDDYVLATGVGTSVKEFWEMAGMPRLCIKPSLMRPAEVNRLVGNAAKADNVLGWKPKTSLEELVSMMIEADRAVA